jgi:hypothetical protein
VGVREKRERERENGEGRDEEVGEKID